MKKKNQRAVLIRQSLDTSITHCVPFIVVAVQLFHINQALSKKGKLLSIHSAAVCRQCTHEEGLLFIVVDPVETSLQRLPLSEGSRGRENCRQFTGRISTAVLQWPFSQQPFWNLWLQFSSIRGNKPEVSEGFSFPFNLTFGPTFFKVPFAVVRFQTCSGDSLNRLLSLPVNYSGPCTQTWYLGQPIYFPNHKLFYQQKYNIYFLRL